MKSLKSILKESEDKYIDIHSVDLQHEYRKYAAELFDNDMPLIPIEIKKLSAGGAADATRSKVSGRLTPKRIIISSKFKFTPDALKNVLVHEMIHIWLYHNQVWDAHGGTGGHGYNFKSKMREINAKGFNIETHNHEGEIAVENKGLYVLLIKRSGQYMMIPFTPKQRDQFMEYFDERYNDEHTGKYWETNLVFSTDPELMKYPKFRTPQNAKRYMITPEFYNSLLQNSIKQAA